MPLSSWGQNVAVEDSRPGRDQRTCSHAGSERLAPSGCALDRNSIEG